jgi:hypothetical protein
MPWACPDRECVNALLLEHTPNTYSSLFHSVSISIRTRGVNGARSLVTRPCSSTGRRSANRPGNRRNRRTGLLPPLAHRQQAIKPAWYRYYRLEGMGGRDRVPGATCCSRMINCVRWEAGGNIDFGQPVRFSTVRPASSPLRFGHLRHRGRPLLPGHVGQGEGPEGEDQDRDGRQNKCCRSA